MEKNTHSQSSKSKLTAGPWVGEFGWELFCWQGYVRKQSRQFDKTVVLCPSGHEFLYQDFAETIPYNAECGETDSWLCKGHTYEGFHEKPWLNPQDRLVTFTLPSGEGKNFTEQEFIPYGKKGKGYDIIIHARSTVKCGTGIRNWDKWDELLPLLKGYSIASIGSLTQSKYIKGTTDLRGISLDKLADVLHSSKVIVGSSSGPMHFASLCKLPQVVWSEPKNKERYEKFWNPFNTKVEFIPSWQPDVKLVVDKVHKCML